MNSVTLEPTFANTDAPSSFQEDGVFGIDAPETVFLLGQITPHMYLVAPLAISIEFEEDGECIVSDDIFLVYGTGATEEVALNDYVVSLVDYYRTLRSEPSTPQVSEQLSQLLRYVSFDADKAA